MPMAVHYCLRHGTDAFKSSLLCDAAILFLYISPNRIELNTQLRKLTQHVKCDLFLANLLSKTKKQVYILHSQEKDRETNTILHHMTFKKSHMTNQSVVYM